MYQRLIEPIEERMIAIVTRIMQDHHDAMDVFQEVLAVVWKKLKAIDRHPNAQAYILCFHGHGPAHAHARRSRQPDAGSQ